MNTYTNKTLHSAYLTVPLNGAGKHIQCSTVVKTIITKYGEKSNLAVLSGLAVCLHPKFKFSPFLFIELLSNHIKFYTDL